ncbi:DUF6377 domain-containing protein [Arcticibacter tournemirensis]|uniref:DUF6377 domain-containing protein n=2 Tax=Pseudomonadati TaxID=3379134 RepID=A0A4Q0M4B8_9SPHI|nr:DUF6377 domain-containing protein [Arcticibacter tournemirensis]RXF67798.1 hypothetical protein EKH83_18420 [Arcticibacter tournemirensis]
MKKILSVAAVILVSFTVSAQASKDTIYSYLYNLLEHKEIYVNEKNAKISQIKNMLALPGINGEQRYDINHRLYNEYKTFISDSAIYYTRQNLEIAKKLDRPLLINESKLDLVSLYVIAGMYIESLDLLKSIDKRGFPDWLLIKYYDSYKQLYSYYSHNNPYTRGYIEKSNLYRDSLLSILDKKSNHYKIVYAEKLYDANRLNEAKEILRSMLDATKSDTHEKAVLAYALANTYGKEKNISLQRYYYALSAVCDIKNAIKENASTQALASVLYKTGQLEEAYNCIRSSMEDAMFCNARLRTYEVSQIFPIIDSAYKKKIDGKNKALQLYLLLVSILSVFLIIAIVFVYRQMKKIAGIRKELYETNVRLSELNSEMHCTNDRLQLVNGELVKANASLSEANQIKETYIGHFLDLCSTYIDKLEKYQNSLNRKAMERKLDELYRMLKSRDMIDNELKELYENFDNTFLHLYPNFVEEFNSLLVAEEQFVTKPGELLNVELRIFALIRLGITDSSRIARFLHYSANTIYSYRTRVRNKAAVPRDEFENMVLKIGYPIKN